MHSIELKSPLITPEEVLSKTNLSCGLILQFLQVPDGGFANEAAVFEVLHLFGESTRTGHWTLYRVVQKFVESLTFFNFLFNLGLTALNRV
jgi:hypothetical protein